MEQSAASHQESSHRQSVCTVGSGRNEASRWIRDQTTTDIEVLHCIWDLSSFLIMNSDRLNLDGETSRNQTNEAGEAWYRRGPDRALWSRATTGFVYDLMLSGFIAVSLRYIINIFCKKHQDCSH